MAIHLVTVGDTLSALAQRYLGDAGRWREIFEWNKAIIFEEQARRRYEGADKSVIYPGTRLLVLDPSSPIVPIR